MSGVFGVVSKNDCRELLFYGTDYQSHLGTQYGGLAVFGDDFVRKIHDISNAQFKNSFFQEYKDMPGSKGIGVISAAEPQPMMVHSRIGTFAVCVDGNINNKDALADELLAKGMSFTDTRRGSVNSSELLAKLISLGDDIPSGISGMFDQVKGAATVLVLCEAGIYCGRSKHGHSPLVIGQNGSSWCVTTETTAYPNLGVDITRYLTPGEIVLLTDEGMQQCAPGDNQNQVCTFLWIYTGFPASNYEGINTEVVRERCGRNLAEGDDVETDLAAGVPDSGIGHAIGYAAATGKPYRRPLVKYTPGYGRSYTPPSQEIRDLVAKMKLVPIREIIEGNRLIVCDDSIVRGTQLKNFTLQKLWQNGAKAVHLRIACPPLMFPCRYDISTRSVEELAARRAIKAIEGAAVEDVSEYLDSTSDKYAQMVDWINNDLGATSLKYQTLEQMESAIGMTRGSLCTYCWSGCGT